MAVLEIQNLKKSFPTPEGGVLPVVDVPRFSLARGEHIALRGESGSGKTTLLHLIAGILQADGGSIRIADREISSLGESARDLVRAMHIGYVFQTFNLLQGYSALENVELGMMFGRGVNARHARALLERVGLADRINYRPSQLSAGQQQRVAVARALANQPSLVLADEPTGNLDQRRAGEALSLVREICKENGAALLLVSHDPQVLGQFEKVEDLARINRACWSDETAMGAGR